LHVIVMSAVLLNFSASTPLPADRPVSVELISPSDMTQVKAGKKNAPENEGASAPKPEEKKPDTAAKAPEPKLAERQSEKQAAPPPPKAEPPKAAEAEARPQPEKKVEAKPEPPAPPKQEEAPKVEKDAPKPEKLAEAKAKSKPEPKPEPKPAREATPFRDRIADVLKHPAEQERKAQPAPPAETKREFDPDRISALLNRDPKAGAPAAQEGPREPWRKPSSLQDQAMATEATAPPREAQGMPSGQDARMSANEIDAFRAQISRCWTPPVGGLGADAIVVKLRIALNKDGTLARSPQIANQAGSPFFTAAADSAMRAVLQCQPYTMPPEKFSQWQDMLLNFDPRRMYGG